jgi:hypothetical protein
MKINRKTATAQKPIFSQMAFGTSDLSAHRSGNINSRCNQRPSVKAWVFCFGRRIMNKKELDRFEEILDRFGASVAKLLETTEQMKKAVDKMVESSQVLIDYYDEKKKIERKP